jgi:hypothetical protein
MIAASHVRRAVVFLLLAAVLLTAMTPRASGLVLAILCTRWFFIAISLNIPLPHVNEQGHTQQVLAIPAFSPRPPPAL